MSLLDKFDPILFLNINATKLSPEEVDITRDYLNAFIGEYILLKLSNHLTEEQITQLIEPKNKDQILTILENMIPDTRNAVYKELENFKRDYGNLPPITPSIESVIPAQEVEQQVDFPISPENTDHIGRAHQVVNLSRISLPKKAAFITAGIGLIFMTACNPSVRPESPIERIRPKAQVTEKFSEQEPPQRRKPIEIIVVREEKLATTKTVAIKSSSLHPDSLTPTRDVKPGAVYRESPAKDGVRVYQRAAEISPELHQRLMDKIKPINDLLPPEKRATRIDFYPSTKTNKLDINGYAVYTPPWY